MNLYETNIHGQRRKILKFLAEQGPQPSLGAIARGIGDSTAETWGYWQALEEQGLVRRATDKGGYALACRLVTGEKDPTRFQSAYRNARQYKRLKEGQTGEGLSKILEFLDTFYGAEFRNDEIADGTGMSQTHSLTNVSEILKRMARNGLVKDRKLSPKIYLFSAVNDPGINEAMHYLKTYADQWHRSGAIAPAIRRPMENVRMVLRVLHHRGVADKKMVGQNGHCLWQWSGIDE